jgi:arylsulfatase A-like enzyme
MLMKPMTGKNRFLGGAFFFITLLMSAATSLHPQNLPQSVKQDVRPNILVIITDDQRFDTVKEYMPRTQARIFDEGVTFTSAYVTTPLCSPSRASILTGLYASHHGVRNNDSTLKVPTFVPWLQQSGYYTGLVGKYLNSEDATPKPGYDYWIGLPDAGSYNNPLLNINGNWTAHQGYLTYLLRDYAINFLRKAAGRGNQPFFLFFNPRTPHTPLQAAPGDENLYSDLPPHRPPSYNEIDLSDKPQWLLSRPLLDERANQEIDNFRRRQLQMLWSLDQSIDAILEELENQNRLDQTVIIYISDNGYFWGEHRLIGKVRVYEPASRIALGLRYPPLVPAGAVEPRLAANIDLAPTIMQLAGLTIPNDMDGRSLVPLLQKQPSWRTDLLIEGWPLDQFYSAVHTERYVYVNNENDRPELYDLAKDPYQLQNCADVPAYATVTNDMRRRLRHLLTSVGDSTLEEQLPSSFTLFQNHPNPFNRITTIRFHVSAPENVVLQVFDLNGRLVTTLANRRFYPGEYAFRFNSASLPNGVYIYRLHAGALVQQRKLVVMK